MYTKTGSAFRHPRRRGASITQAAQDQMEADKRPLDFLEELRSGRRETLDRLMPMVYDHLRVIASRQLALREGNGTLSTTGLIHEAYLKLAFGSGSWSGRFTPSTRRPMLSYC